MRRLVIGTILMALAASTADATTTLREARIRSVLVTQSLPTDLTSPEGKTRWHLESLAPGTATTVAISREDQGLVLESRPSGASSAERVALSGADAERWLLPDHDPAQMKMGGRVVLEFSETRDGLVDRMIADVATVGIGWIHLPGEPHEVVLQRALVLRQRAGERAMRPELLIHRWVDPREGVVAAISGPVSADGRARLTAGSIEFTEKVTTGAATMKLYADQIYRGAFIDVKYGYDARGAAVDPLPVSSLVPDPGIHNICDLVNLTTWNFSGITAGQETATTETPSSAAESCNASRCGYAGYPQSASMGPAILERLDSDLLGTKRKDNQVVQRENRASDVTFWLRAGTQKEGVSGGFGTGETRFCFSDEIDKPRSEVPIWQMTHNDAGGWYAQASDWWSSIHCSINTNKMCVRDTDCLAAEGTCVNSCQETFYTSVCGVGGSTFWGGKCTASGQVFGGGQFGKIVKGGVVTLPSGHTLNALVLRNTTEFGNFLGSACGFCINPVRTIVYVFQAPFVGSVALLRGAQRVDFTPAEVSAAAETPCTNFSTVEFTDISYGLLPPVSITAGAVTGTTASISWNPGNDTHRIVGYKLYWDTDPGASSPYAFDSVANAGQVAFAGTTATISGLTPGTLYYFTVTSLSDFQDPFSLVTTRYESIRYPTTVSGDPNFSYPIEVSSTTTGGCVLQGVNGLRVDKSAPNLHVCWVPPTDTCAVGWSVKTSDTPGPGGFGVVGQLGATNCWDGNPPSQSPLLFIQVGP